MSKKSRRKAKEKAKKAAFIAKISFDGKINKKEAKKAAKKGISLQTIQNENIRTFNRAKKNYDPDLTTTGRYGRGTAPTFQPLLIKRKARDTFNSSSQAPAATETAPAATETATETAPVTAEPTMQEMFNNYTSQLPDYGAMMEQSNASNAKMVQDLMASNQQAANERAAQYEASLNQMREEQMAAQAEYQRQAAEQQKQFELAQRTSLGNQARSGQQVDYQLGGSPGMRRGGTFGFRRRPRQLMGGIGASAMVAPVAALAGGTLNV